MDIVFRASIMFAVLYALLRLLGKRELNQMTPFELVLLIVMGDLIQQGVPIMISASLEQPWRL